MKETGLFPEKMVSQDWVPPLATMDYTTSDSSLPSGTLCISCNTDIHQQL